jgi:hypothetical protein
MTRRRALPSRPSRSLAPLLAALGATLLAGCGNDANDLPASPGPVGGEAPAISVMVLNQVALPQPCMGASLTFFEGAMPVDIDYGTQKPVQVMQLFGGPYEIGFQVNGWYWRTCVGPGDCPNPKNCQNPDNAGQVGIQVASDCSTATLLQNWDTFTCDGSVPNASQAVTVTLQSSNPCTVVVASTATPLQPTDGCCSCSSCTASQIPAGQTLHCQ